MNTIPANETYLKILEAALANVNEKLVAAQEAKASAANARKITALQNKVTNIEALINVYNQPNVSLPDLMVAANGGEVGRLFDLKDNLTAALEFADGAVRSPVPIENLVYDPETSAKAPIIPGSAIVRNKKVKILKFVFPGQIEIPKGKTDTQLIGASAWKPFVEEEALEQPEVLETDPIEEAPKKDEIVAQEVASDKSPGSSLSDMVLAEPFQRVNDEKAIADEPEHLNLINPQVRVFDRYKFIIGLTGNTNDLNQPLYSGELYFTPIGTDAPTLIAQAEPSPRYHAVRSALVVKYHQESRDLIILLDSRAKTQNKKTIDEVQSWIKEEKPIFSIDPFLLAFTPVNADTYHPNSLEDDVTNLLESIDKVGEILQSLGVSEIGQIYSGHRRCAAAIIKGLATVPIEIRIFNGDRAKFVEAILETNVQRVKDETTRTREMVTYREYCMPAAAAARNSALKSNTSGEKIENFGITWERTKEYFGVNKSIPTLAGGSQVVKFIDTCPDQEFARYIQHIYNHKSNPVSSCLQLIKTSAAPDMYENAKEAARLMAEDNANSANKALLRVEEKQRALNGTSSVSLSPVMPRTGLISRMGEPSTVSAATLRNNEPSGQEVQATTSAPIETRNENGYSVSSLPPIVMQGIIEVLQKIDIDVHSSIRCETDADYHLTGISENLDGLAAEWRLPGGRAAKPTIVFGNFCNLPQKEQATWLTKAQNQYRKGHVAEGIFVLYNPSPELISITKDTAAVSVLIPFNEKGRLDSLTVYYFGNRWEAVDDAFDSIGEVRIRPWALTASKHAEQIWVLTDDSYVTQYRGFDVTVSQDPDSTTWHGYRDGTRIITCETADAVKAYILPKIDEEIFAMQ